MLWSSILSVVSINPNSDPDIAPEAVEAVRISVPGSCASVEVGTINIEETLQVSANRKARLMTA